MMGGGGGGGRWNAPRGPQKPLKPDTMKRVMGTFVPYRGQLVLIALAVFASVAVGLAQPFFLRIIIDHGLLKHRFDIVVRFSIFSLLAILASTAFGLAYGYISVLVGQNIMRDLRDRLYVHLQGMSLRFFSGTRTGEIQSRLANDVGGVQSVLSDTVASILNNVTTVISTIVAMVFVDWRLTLLSIGIMPLFALIGSRVGDGMRTVRGTVQSNLAEINSTMQETLSVSGALLTKTSGRGGLAMKKFSRDNDRLTMAQIKMAMIMRFFFNLIGLTFSITPVLVYWLAGWLIIRHGSTSLTLGSIVAFTALQARILFPLQQLMSSQVDVMSSLALFDRIFEYLDLKQEIVDAPNAVELDPATLKGDVEFRDVNFRYADDGATTSESGRGAGGEGADPGWTLRDIDFVAKPGQLIALVGHSGAGKTTLTYLIPRLYDPTSGKVLIDGHDAREIKLESLGQIVGMVTQETYLVHDTIRENLRYGKPDATDDELIAAARTAAIHDHIASLPEGYDTVVGERGYKLSGGEKQRIAIARAVLKNPRILILDEATSSLDTQSERLIQAALTPLMAGRTTFAIAHRLSTILAADLILVMDKGRIVERGTHESLLAKHGAYAALYAAQFEQGISDALTA